MSITVCLAASTIYYPEGAGHMWVYLNWALGLRANGCRVIWLEGIKKTVPKEKTDAYILALKERLKPYNLHYTIALWQTDGSRLQEQYDFCMSVESAAEQADLFLNQDYSMPSSIVSLFKNRTLLDVDPGLLQTWIARKCFCVALHDLYFSIGETVGRPNSLFPNCGLDWKYTPPCVSLDHWKVAYSPENAPLTTVTHWLGDTLIDENGKEYYNDKRSGYLPFFELPKYSPFPLELAICLDDVAEEDRKLLEQVGWSLKNSHTVASTLSDYQNYIGQSAGEFSCVKPSCIRLQNAWISDRTLCYLASGKPAVVQHTGPSKFLPDNAGLLRFHDFKEAIRCLENLAANYDKHSRLARLLAEEYFDAKKVTKSLLERALA